MTAPPSTSNRRSDTRAARAQIILRLRFAPLEPQLGPGKIELMERIDAEGSISAAGRAMKMSYHRAWTIVKEINVMFREPLITAQPGGSNGGGAIVTPLGRDVVRRYRSMETALWRHAAVHIAALEALSQAAPAARRKRARKAAR